jgi:predicted nucleic-acid-binding Zn-ribbon protein
VQLFHDVNTDRNVSFYGWSGVSETLSVVQEPPRAPPGTTGNWKEEHIQLTGNKKHKLEIVEKRFGWSECNYTGLEKSASEKDRWET